eukprot:maker-scaffold_52-augustus-gene-1.0-mRNA-1 protein AED:0.16 eAED:0.17 QI:0/0/0.5/1/0/0.5/2/1605/861
MKAKIKPENDDENESRVKARENWSKLRLATKMNNILRSMNHDVKLVGREVNLENDFESAYKEILEKAVLKKRWYIILPRSRERRMWETFIVLLLFYILIVVPVRVCFDILVTGWAAALDLIIDMLFILDILVNFVSAYISEENEIIVDQFLIAKRYAKTWLFLDLVASIPFHYIIESQTTSSNTQINRLSRIARLPRVLKLAKLLKLLKLLRILRMVRYLSKVESQLGFHVAITRMFKVLFGVAIVTHFIGCLWFMTSWVGNDNLDYYLENNISLDDRDPNTVSWVERYSLVNSTVASQYLASVYWAFSTLTTVGFGDIAATTNLERSFAVICMVLGVSWYAFIISTISSIINMFDRRSAKIRQNLGLVVQFMRDQNVPWALRNRVVHHVEYSSTASKLNTEKDLPKILDLLSEPLRIELLLHVHRETIMKLTFFRHKSPQFVVQCVTKLKHLFLRQNEFIYKRGQHCTQMYFLLKGKVVLYPDIFRKKKFRIFQGSFFGEIACILHQVCTESAKAEEECDLLAWNREDVEKIMQDFPEVAEELFDVAQLRIQKFQRLRDQKNLRSVLNRVIENRESEEANTPTLQNLKRRRRLFGSVGALDVNPNPETSTSPKSSPSTTGAYEEDRVMDILLVMDCTASMSPWISLCKQTLTNIIDAAKDDHPELSVRVAFVGYRDFMDKNSLFYIHDFSLETEKLKSFIAKAKDKGGNDIPEDLQGALHQGLKLNWRKNSIKVCHVCTDAPAHGKTYHSVSDDHPKGNPAGLVLEDLMLQYSNYEVDVTLYHLTDQTTKMFEIMKGAYNQGSKEDGFEIIDLREKLQEAKMQGEDLTAPTSNFYSGYVASVSHDVALRRHNSYARRGWS